LLALGVSVGQAQATSLSGGGSAAQPVYQTELTKFQGSNPQFAFTYICTLSSTAQAAFLANDATKLGVPVANGAACLSGPPSTRRPAPLNQQRRRDFTSD
jgi:hypothetical protein